MKYFSQKLMLYERIIIPLNFVHLMQLMYALYVIVQSLTLCFIEKLNLSTIHNIYA